MSETKLGAKYDKVLIGSVIGLVSIGLVMVFSTSSIYSAERFGDQYHFLVKQGAFALLGFMLMVIGMKINLSFIRNISYPLLGFSFALLVFILVSKVGVLRSGSASRWIGFANLTFQPAEFAKISLIIFLAAFLSKQGENITSFKRVFLPSVLISGLLIVCVFAQPDFGTAATLALIVFLMLFVVGSRIVYLAGCLAFAIPPMVFLVLKSGYRLKRVLTFFDPWKDPLGSGFQIIQSYIAFANGGFLGEGLGDGKQKLLYLPEAHTDFIFSVVGEELGFIGVVLVLFLFGVFVHRGFSIALRLRDSFAVLLSVGITAMVGMQALINMGVTMGLLPTKGLPLPFISYGGSSLVVMMFASGILINLSARMNQVPNFNLPGRV